MSDHDHAFLAPSSAHEWINCGLAPHLSSITQDLRDGDEDKEGNAAHAHAAQLLTTGELIPVGTQMNNGVTVTDEMLEGSMTYAEHIQATLGPILPKLIVEQLVHVPSVNGKCYGTPDAYALYHGNPCIELHLFDYKFGHRFVEVFENWQLLLYVIGVLDASNIPPSDWFAVQVTMHIVQPRTYTSEGPIRTWTITADKLHPYISELAGAATRALSSQRVGRAGEWCRDCVGRRRCEANQKSAYRSIHESGRATPVDLDDRALSRELRSLHYAQTMLESRITGLEQQALHRLQAGAHLADYGIDYTRPHRRWSVPAETVLAVGEMLGKDLAKSAEPAVLTPAQAKKLGIDESVIVEYASYPPGSAKLVPVDTTKTRKIFA